MGGKGGNNRGPNATAAPRRGPMTLRQQATLEKQGNLKSISIGSETMLKLDHLKSIASWAATEARIPQLAAFYGRRYAATTEEAGVPPDPSLFYCERCESILEPGTNCTVRVEPNKARRRRRRRKNPTNNNPLPPPQNYIVYTCKVCSHRNAMRGTPKGYMKEMFGPRIKDRRPPTSKPSADTNIDLPIVCAEGGEPNGPLTATAPMPGNTPTLTLLESKTWGRRSGAKKSATKRLGASLSSLSEADGEKSMAASSKKRRKSGMSLKEIAERDNRQRGAGLKFENVSIPFDL